MSNDSLSFDRLAAAIAKEANITIKEAGRILTATITVLKNSAHEGRDVILSGYGRLRVKHRGACTKVVPGKGAVEIPAKKVLSLMVNPTFAEELAS